MVIFDNRGQGRSSVPPKKSEYSTEIMAADTVAVMVGNVGRRGQHGSVKCCGCRDSSHVDTVIPATSLKLVQVCAGTKVAFFIHVKAALCFQVAQSCLDLLCAGSRRSLMVTLWGV